jgi:predicted SprT family Zn-dependent metalloprotease
MRIEDVKTLALELLNLHGLSLPIRFSRARRVLGCITFRNRVAFELAMSTSYVTTNDEPEVKDLILHEIAHALVGHEHGHDHVWKAKCREIGARPEQYAKLSQTKMMHTHEVKCTACGCVYKKLFAKSSKDYSRYTCRCDAERGTIKCVAFWTGVEDELRKLVHA